AGAAVCVGASPLGVLLYYLLRGPVDALAHGNIRLPAGLDRALRRIVVTPDFHAVHHSAARRETDSNFSTLFSWWDSWFGTVCTEPNGGVAGMALGLEGFRENRDLDLDRMLWQPFRSEVESADEKARAQAGE
ncbi:MAG: sterol desaturase family protein, partial [Myxococcales bacterium]|nr:sterol desaturase family protein [Myxococcales bacterium]